MQKSRYQRSIEELRSVASMFWPDELNERAATLSVIPKLLETQDQFISILSVPARNLDGIFAIVDNSRLPANLFLKHLVILSDFGGEMLQRVNDQFDLLFPGRRLEYVWNGDTKKYEFGMLPLASRLTNDRLGISGKKLFAPQPLNDLHRDVIALLLLGSVSTNANTARVLSKCEISEYLGQPHALEQFIRQRYIWVSRITGGSQSNNLGQIAQQFVQSYLEDHLKAGNVTIKSNGHLPGVTHTSDDDSRETTFDLVASRGEKSIGIEITFQVTTNSVIERKGGQARSRFEQVEQKGHKIAYVIDGAGNFMRETAVSTICNYSHCTVALKPSELNLLVQFIQENL